MFASIPLLAYGIQSYTLPMMLTLIFTVAALYSGFFATLIWNDITDADIDAVAHPDRPLPAKRIQKNIFFSIAVVFSALTFLFSYLVNIYCFLLVVAAALFVTFHNKYLRRRIHFSAYSEIFSPIQWVIVPLFGFLAAGHIDIVSILLLAIFTYCADSAHDLPEGIHDKEGDQTYGVRTYATSFGEKKTAKISFTLLFLSGIIGIILTLKTILTLIFLIPFLLIWLYTLYYSFAFMKSEKNEMQKEGKILGRKIFDYFLLSYDFIFLDMIVRLLLYQIF
jgi:4-hydroxybenzoate polyprenyltransferase